ncbi:multicopper oxidase domain-containing protein, partial [Nitrosomonas nitrosa]
MTTGIGPYVTPDAADIDTDPSPNVLEITLTISQQTVDIGGGVMANAETINGTIPGPTLRLNVGDTVIVRVVNDLPHPSGIHWHGIELHNSADGTPVTQNGIPVGPFVQPSPLSPTGGTYLYKFKVPRPGIY